MNTIQEKQDPNPPVVQENILSPIIQPISEQELSGLRYTGLHVELDLPLVVDSGDPLFAINTDGFIPMFNYKRNVVSEIWANLMPVQPFQTSQKFVKVFYQPIPDSIQAKYHSHRFVDGSVGIVMRIVSNVGQTGNLILSHATGVARRFYKGVDKYNGVKFLTNPTNSFTQALPGYVLADISTNRNLRLTTVNNNPNNVTDIAQKLYKIVTLSTMNANEVEPMRNQFTEDWVIVGALNSFPSTGGPSLQFSFFFDYSRVTFAMPMYPIIPTVPWDVGMQIFKFSESFQDKVITSVDIHKPENWRPGPPTKKEREQNKKSLLRTLQQIMHDKHPSKVTAPTD